MLILNAAVFVIAVFVIAFFTVIGIASFWNDNVSVKRKNEWNIMNFPLPTIVKGTKLGIMISYSNKSISFTYGLAEDETEDTKQTFFYTSYAHAKKQYLTDLQEFLDFKNIRLLPKLEVISEQSIEAVKKQSNNSELVVAVHRESLNIPAVSGVHEFDFSKVKPDDYALLPRHIVDDKSDASVGLGAIYPQILVYAQLVDKQGKYLTYARKGSEKGLHGLRSIGIGGHVSNEDYVRVVMDTKWYEIPSVQDVVFQGFERELEEEVGLTNFEHTPFDRVLVSDANKTSLVHVGLPTTIVVNPTELKLSDEEFLDVQWLTKEELEQTIESYEPWSQELILTM